MINQFLTLSLSLFIPSSSSSEYQFIEIIIYQTARNGTLYRPVWVRIYFSVPKFLPGVLLTSSRLRYRRRVIHNGKVGPPFSNDDLLTCLYGRCEMKKCILEDILFCKHVKDHHGWRGESKSNWQILFAFM